MKNSLLFSCELLAANRNAVKKAFPWESAYIFPLCASMYASKGRQADVYEMKRCRELLKKKTSVFSNFRGASKLATATLLALEFSPEQALDRMLEVYKALRGLFMPSQYLAVTATAIASMAEPARYESMIKETRAVYDGMKRLHPFLTTSEDSAFTALLALTGRDADALVIECESCYRLLKPHFASANATLSLAGILALGEATAEHKCQRTMELFNMLKQSGRKYGTYYELPTLGALALPETDVRTIFADIKDADEFLKKQKGFGAFGVGKKQRLMYAGLMAMSEYLPKGTTMQTAAMSTVVSLIIAQQAAICACIAASGASAASASAGAAA